MAILSHPIIHLALLVLLAVVTSSTSLPFGGGRGRPVGLPPHNHDQAHRRQAPSQSATAPQPPSQPPILTIIGGSGNSSCVTADMPNPIAPLYPNNATGVLNATLAILPIPMSTARRLIPAQWAILERPLRTALPGFPEGMYPVLLQAAHDHDIQIRGMGLGIADFSRAGFEFPFIDLLGDGYSSFRWAPAQLISAEHKVAISGSIDYGTIVHPATFEPACDAFQLSCSTNPQKPLYSFSASSASAGSSVSLKFELSAQSTPGQHRQQGAESLVPYPISFFKNITNQPSFANGSTCDNMIRLFNTTLTSEAEGRAPRPITGRLSTTKIEPFFSGLNGQEDDGVRELRDMPVQGIQVATAFIENNYLNCQSMKGYMGTGGPGDS